MKPSTVSTVLVLATAIALANAKAIDKRDDTLADYAAVEQQEGVATLLKRLVDTTIGATEAPQTEDLIIVPDTTPLFEEKTVSQRIKKAEGDESDDDEDYDEDEGEEEEGEEEANGVDVFVVDFNSNFCDFYDTISADSVMTVEEATAQQAAIMEANAMAEAEEAKEDEADSDDEDEDEGKDEDYEDEDYNDGEDEGEGEVEAQAVVPEIVAEASEIPEDITLDATKKTTAEVTVEKPAAQERVEKHHHHHRE
ncbi:hypothetical protein BG005_008012 [Podila minutissima]|nr:hypothetical protein BG005_008012 [Podila minutissima]